MYPNIQECTYKYSYCTKTPQKVGIFCDLKKNFCSQFLSKKTISFKYWPIFLKIPDLCSNGQKRDARKREREVVREIYWMNVTNGAPVVRIITVCLSQWLTFPHSHWKKRASESERERSRERLFIHKNSFLYFSIGNTYSLALSLTLLSLTLLSLTLLSLTHSPLSHSSLSLSYLCVHINHH